MSTSTSTSGHTSTIFESPHGALGGQTTRVFEAVLVRERKSVRRAFPRALSTFSFLRAGSDTEIWLASPYAVLPHEGELPRRLMSSAGVLSEP